MTHSLSGEQLKALRTAVDELKKNPNLINHPDLVFYKDFLTGFQIPTSTTGQDSTFQNKGKRKEYGANKEGENLTENDTKSKKRKEEKPETKEKEEEKEEKEEEDIDDAEKASIVPPDEIEEDKHAYPDTEKEPSDDDISKADQFKVDGRDALAKNEIPRAIELFTKALFLQPSSTLILADRAKCFLKQKKPKNAIKDCDRALSINPDSAKAYRIRGQAKRLLGQWEGAHADLGTANRLDYDEETFEQIKNLQERVDKIRAKRLQKDREAEDKKREEMRKDIEKRRKEEMERQAKEDVEAEGGDDFAQYATGGLPKGFNPKDFAKFFSGGFPGAAGRGGSSNGGSASRGTGSSGTGSSGAPPNIDPKTFSQILSDPDVKQAMEDSKTKAELIKLLQDPSKITDVKDAAILKIFNKYKHLLDASGAGKPGSGPSPRASTDELD